MLRGVDCSSFQGVPRDWQAAAGAIDWAAVKVSEAQPGGVAYVDPDAAADWAWLKSEKKGRVAYLYGHPTAGASASVSLFVTEVRKLGLEDGDGIALDLEEADGLSAAAVNTWAADVMRLLEREVGRRPVLYSFLSFIWGGNCASLGEYPLWISDPSAPAGHPQVPDPWKHWALHQYEITGPVDRDVASWPTLEEMAAALGKPKPAAAPVPLPASEVEHWHTIGLWSLAREAEEHKTTPDEMILLAKGAGHVYGPAMAEYIRRGDWSARVPAHTELFAPKR